MIPRLVAMVMRPPRTAEQEQAADSFWHQFRNRHVHDFQPHPSQSMAICIECGMTMRALVTRKEYTT